MKIILFLLLISAISFAQVRQEWTRYYNGPANYWDNATDIEVDTNGYVYVAGTSHNGIGGSDFAIVKYDFSGQQLWVERYNPNNGLFSFEQSTLDYEGNIILTGFYLDHFSDTAKVITIKYNPQGQLLWSNTFFNPDYDIYSRSITTDNEGNIYVVGVRIHYQNDDQQIFTFKYNSSGDLQWVKYYGIQAYADIYDSVVDTFGNVYISGVVGVDHNDDVKIVTIKYNSSGVEEWIRTTDTSPFTYVKEVSLDDSGNVYVVGNEYSSDGFGTFIFKYNNSGSLIWTQMFLDQFTNGAAVNSNGEIYFLSWKYVSGWQNSSIVKCNSDGVKEWESIYEHPSILVDLVLDEFGNVYTAGYDLSEGWQQLKSLTIKFNNNGVIQWVEKNIPTNNAQESLRKIALDKNRNVYVTGYSSTNSNYDSYDYLTIKYSQPHYPVIIVPGVAGTYASDVDNDLYWLNHRGASPEHIQIDPLANVYTDLITTLENVGYEKDKDLFIVNYDWRLLPAPIDNNFDGYIEGLTGQSISDEEFNFGVDYLGYYLREAANRWRIEYNEELEYVDIIVHSTGGIVTRSYIQSPAYGDVYDAVNNYKLPRIRNFMMIGVPNRGASKAWNPLHDNWIADPAYRFVLSKIINRAFQKIKKGYVIYGPDHFITWGSILDSLGNPDKVKFINKYVPTIRGLLATYDFLDIGNGPTNVNNDPSVRNNLILDLNNGYDLYPNADPNGFLDSAIVSVLFGNGQNTFDYVLERTDGEYNAIQSFTDWTRTSVFPGTIWYKDMVSNNNNGDGTVPLQSSVGQFLGDSRVTLYPFGVSDHTGMVQTIPVQSTILDILNINYDQSSISTGSGADVSNVLSIISDPVESVITDGLGRRLGYTNGTGKLTEIPNSMWMGNTEGMGYVFGSVQEPITLQLTGLGEDYYVMVSIDDSNEFGGITLEGFLSNGEQATYLIELNPLSVEKVETLNPDNFTLAQNYPNPFNPVTTIQYSIPQRSRVILRIYDVLGNEVATPVNEEKDRGVYSIGFDGSNLSSGIYFYRLQAGSFIQTKKMILIK